MTTPTPKRRFRFSLRTLLLVPVVVAAACWWLIWPERTARTFVERLNAGEVEAAKAMIDGSQPSAGFWKIVSSGKFTFGRPEMQDRPWSDYLASRRGFLLPAEIDSLPTANVADFQFLAHRGSVKIVESSGPRTPVIFVLSFLDATTMTGELTELYPDRDTYAFKADVENDNNYVLVAAPNDAHSEIAALVALLDVEAR